MQKNVLITGASSGIGKALAHMLLDRGDWVVYAGARRLDSMQDLAERGAYVFEIDVTKDNDLEKAAKAMIQNDGRIDALVANAGYGSYGMVEAVPIGEIQRQFDVNVLGVARSLQAVLPQMRKQHSGRILITESIVSHVSTLGLGWYAATKHALRGMSVALRQEVKELGIHVIAIEPGAVDTEFDDVAFEKLNAVQHPDEYNVLVRGFHAYMVDVYRKVPGPESTAKAMVEALTAPNPSYVYKSTADAKFGPLFAGLVPDSVYDRMVLSMFTKVGR
jgi:short-subunit dehydrogenase